ncbi:ABC-2 type transport system permease protein [Kitasatospora sp. MAP12-15]|uniref:ABC transporter permease n=1 Tax=unclassified Kitasatospora TaxID=2633591 RepID=UPI0024736BB3|nr:ABC transporter permease [Kitasatospora sp. MAP12-44]MDH6115060.1 ABC-2 type transport system permease protein [Kitasatospora sp. MAP12-44]
MTTPTTEPRARFADLLASEWIKTRSLRSTPWALAFTALFIIGSAAVAALADYGHQSHSAPLGQRLHLFALGDAFPPAGYLTLMLVAGSIGAVTIVGEYSSGLIRTTTVAVPARGAVLLAKAIVLAAVWTVLGTVISTVSFALSQSILDGWHVRFPITHPHALQALAASALLAPVCALVGLGLGVLIRHSAATMVTTAFTLLMLPTIFSSSTHWSADVRHAMVQSAWGRLIQDWDPSPHDSFYVPTVAGSWVTYAAWPLIAVLLALVAVRRRDV